MNLSRCSNGHFYDKEKFPTCPYCAQGAGNDIGPGNEGLTVVFPESQENDIGATQPLTYNNPPQQPQAGGYVQNNIQTEQNMMNNFGRGGHEEVADATETLGGNQDSFIGRTEPRKPSVKEVQKITPGGVMEEDDDHTVAFYDDIFSSPTTSKANTAPVKETVAKEPVKRSVSTPCTGWVIALDGNHLGEDFRLKVGKNFVGRDTSMDIALVGDKSVSRNKHAILVYEPKQHLYLVQPGESSELVYLNDEVVLSPMKLQAYDVITVGEVKLLFMPLCGAKFNWTDYLTQNRQ